MGFPATDHAKRVQFYTYSNWCYQAGVFVSRSSGLLYQASVAPAVKNLLVLVCSRTHLHDEGYQRTRVRMGMLVLD